MKLKIVRNTHWNFNLRGNWLIIDALTGLCVFNGFEIRAQAFRALKIMNPILCKHGMVA